MAYRDDLAAAHERIAELERERVESKAPTREAARIAALERERREVVARLESPESELAGLLRWKIYVPFGVTAIVFLIDGDPIVAALTVVCAFVARFIGQKLVASNRREAERHLAQLDAEIARLC